MNSLQRCHVFIQEMARTALVHWTRNVVIYVSDRKCHSSISVTGNIISPSNRNVSLIWQEITFVNLTGNVFCPMRRNVIDLTGRVRPETIDSLVRFSADSKFKGPTKEKNHRFHFIYLFIFLFCRPPDSSKKLRDWFEDQGINCPSPTVIIFSSLHWGKWCSWQEISCIGISWKVSLSTAKRGDNVLGSTRPSVCLFVCLFVCALLSEPFDLLGARLCRVQQRAKKSHYQSKVFVCVPVISGRMRIIARMRSIGF